MAFFLIRLNVLESVLTKKGIKTLNRLFEGERKEMIAIRKKKGGGGSRRGWTKGQV
jgi:hypothetical protein